MTNNIIGIDCATDPKNVGLAFGEFDGQKTTIIEVKKPAKGETVVDAIVSWFKKDIPTLLTIDAPLGWPTDLGEYLKEHSAGEGLDIESNRLFRRITDRRVKEVTGKQSLDVGADRIARTAHAALNLLQGLREKTGEKIPLAWETPLQHALSAIEVYPAATLKMLGMRSSGYKKTENIKERQEILSGLDKLLTISPKILSSEDGYSILEEDDDALDAVVCILAGRDFLIGNVIQYDEIELVKKEGWIWVTPPRKH